jgi:hypothetical protein
MRNEVSLGNKVRPIKTDEYSDFLLIPYVNTLVLPLQLVDSFRTCRLPYEELLPPASLLLRVCKNIRFADVRVKKVVGPCMISSVGLSMALDLGWVSGKELRPIPSIILLFLSGVHFAIT